MASIIRFKTSIILLAFTFISLFIWGEPQDPPDITGYTLPIDDRPAPRGFYMDFIDMGVLFLALSLTAFLVLKKRSRKGIFWLSLFSLGYFGFYRKGCVCPIGSIQNVAEAIFNPAAVASLVVLVFFFLPLLYSAIFGRSYCASVCPHGAIQDAVLFKPIQLPPWLDHCLGLLPFIYLGFGVLYAATGTAYIICDYDPFIAIFRLDGHSSIFGLGALFLITGMFVGRPYCRFMCPYGVLLRIFSVVSKWRVKIYPDRCIDCSLCDNSCPYGAIKTTTANDPAAVNRGIKGFRWLLYASPAIVLLFGFLTSLLSNSLSKSNRYVSLAYEVEQRENELLKGVKEQDLKESEVSESLRNMPNYIGVISESAIDIPGETWDQKKDNLFKKAQSISSSFYYGSWILGLWIGLVICVRLLKLNSRRTRLEYEADRGSCYSCGRCYDYCPGSNGVPLQFETGGHLRL